MWPSTCASSVDLAARVVPPGRRRRRPATSRPTTATDHAGMRALRQEPADASPGRLSGPARRPATVRSSCHSPVRQPLGPPSLAALRNNCRPRSSAGPMARASEIFARLCAKQRRQVVVGGRGHRLLRLHDLEVAGHAGGEPVLGLRELLPGPGRPRSWPRARGRRPPAASSSAARTSYSMRARRSSTWACCCFSCASACSTRPCTRPPWKIGTRTERADRVGAVQRVPRAGTAPDVAAHADGREPLAHRRLPAGLGGVRRIACARLQVLARRIGLLPAPDRASSGRRAEYGSRSVSSICLSERDADGALRAPASAWRTRSS